MIVCIEHIDPGMVLARDVKGLDGSVLIKAGTVLDHSHLVALDELGLSSVVIKPVDKASMVEKHLSLIEAHVRNFFLYVDPDAEAMVEIFRISMGRCVTAVRKGWTIPCRNDIKARNVERLNDLFYRGEGSPEDLVKHQMELASFPDVYFKIKELIDSPTSTPEQIAKVVSTDMALSVRLLKLVNSPIYGLAAKIESVAQAVAVIGTRELATLALGISAINFFKDIPPELIDMKVFWRHSLGCAVFGKLLASRMGLGADTFFTAGLLHDAGRLVMFRNLPYASVQALLYARGNYVPLVDAEKETFGYDHTEVASVLLESWSFPPRLADIIANHHRPFEAKNPREAAIIGLADNLTNAAEISSGGMFVLPGLESRAWELLGLAPQDLDDIFETYDRHISEITSAFL